MHLSARTLLPLLSLALCAPPAATFAQEKYTSNDEKAVYSLGILRAKELRNLLFTERDLEIYQAGMRDEFAGKTEVDFDSQVTNMRQFQQARTRAAAEAEEKAAAEFATRAAAEPGAEKTASGMIFTEISAGTGPNPTVVDTVTVNYHGTLRDGTVFDSSVDRGQPASFPLNRVIPCWTEAVQKMRVGGKAKIVCPPDIAYGDRGAGALIRPGAVLTFEVELISIDSR